MYYAVIDLGSNTIRLSVFRYEDGVIVTVARQKEVVGLAGYVKHGKLDQEGIDKACEALLAFKEIAIRFVPEKEIYVFATASLRGIDNQKEALEKIKFATDLLPDILAGEEEARLDFIGASHFTTCKSGILIDIGGASTELVKFESGQPVQLVSMPVGCLNLYFRFVKKVIPTDEELRAIRKEVRRGFDSLGLTADKEFPLLIGIGGTIRAVLKLSRALFSLPGGQMEIDADFIEEIFGERKRNEHDFYRTAYKVIPERLLTVFPGLTILSEAVKRCKTKRIFVSSYGVREGYLIDRIINGEGGNEDG